MRMTERSVFPFLLGCPRSGTTLLRVIMDSHPEMAVPPESHFIAKLGHARKRYEGRGAEGWDRLADDLVGRSWFEHWRFSEDEVRNCVTDPAVDSYPNAVRRLYSEYARRRDKPHYADKTPKYTLDIPILADLFGEARFVHIIRDGRDVALSLMEKPWGPKTLGDAAVLWKKQVETARSDGRRLDPIRYHELRYHDLVEDTESVVRNASSFLGLDFDPDMLNYFEKERPGRSVAKGNVHRPPTRGMRDWRGQLSHEEVVLFDALAGDLLDELGYEKGRPGASVTERLRARRRAAEVQMKLAARGARRKIHRGVK